MTDNERRGGSPQAGKAPARKYGKPAQRGASGEKSPQRGAPAHRHAKPAFASSSNSNTVKQSGLEPTAGKPAQKSTSGDKSPYRGALAHRHAKPAFAPRTNSAMAEVRGIEPPSGKPAFAPRRSSVGAMQARGSAPVRKYGRPAPQLNARQIALDILRDVHQNGAYASLSLNESLRGKTLGDEDRRLVTNIVYGTLENELQIDYALDKLMDHPTREPSQRDLLRMSAYQILFLERVPDSAAVNEAVKLCKLMGMEAASGFINAVLRNLARGKDDFEWPKRENNLREYISIMGSVPMWIVDRFIADFGEEVAEKALMHRESSHPIVARPNLSRMDDTGFEALLEKKELRYERGTAPHSYLIYGVQELSFDPDYRAGLFSVQGQSSMLAAEAVQAKNGMRILDACAAPGGKSAYMCEQMQMTGRVYAWELHEKRALLLEATKRRLNLESLRISVRDATEPKPDMYGTLDAVLLDAPCSGLGVIAQKPDIKLRLQEADLDEIVKTQAKLLDTVCRYVKPNGVLVYSTCSVLSAENEAQIERFLREHPDFRAEPLPLSFPERLRQHQTPLGLKLFGYRDGTEGFYIVRLRRSR